MPILPFTASLQSNHARQPLAQPLQPGPLGRLLNLPDQVLEIRRLALWLQHGALELILDSPQTRQLAISHHPTEETSKRRYNREKRVVCIAHPVPKLVLHQKLQRPRLEQLLRLHGGLVRAEPLVDDLAQDVLELVVRPEVLLGPFGEDVGVDAALVLEAGVSQSVIHQIHQRVGMRMNNWRRE